MKFKTLILALTVSIFNIFQPFMMQQTAFAVTTNSKDAVCEAVGCSEAETNRVTSTIQNAIRVFQIIAGVVAIFMMIIAGLRFITSSGSSDGVKSARNTILYAAIGIVIVIISEAIIRFVLSRFG